MRSSRRPTMAGVATPAAKLPGRGFAILLGVLALGLAACTTSLSGVAASQSSDGVDRARPSATSDGNQQTTTSSAPTPTRESGLVLSGIGAPVALLDTSGNPIMTLTVEAIVVNPGCDGELALPPEQGHFVIVTVTIDVPATATEPPPQFDLLAWHVIGPNGEPGTLGYSISSYLCTSDSDALAGALSAGTHTGRLVLDTAHASGQLTWTPGSSTATDGWSWSF